MVEESPYVLATCAACGVIHSESAPHSYRYVDDIAFFDEHLLRDPLSMEPIFNPVCLAPPCRHTFSKETIEIAIRQHGCCPLDRTPQTLANVIPAPYLVQNLLDKIRVFGVLLIMVSWRTSYGHWFLFIPGFVPQQLL